MKKFEINPERTVKKLTAFIRKAIKERGFNKVILGLSGGLDSTVVAYLASKALGPKNVIAVIMPCAKLSKKALEHAKKISRSLKLKTYYKDISPAISAYFRTEPSADNMRRGNKMARERMSILYDLSKKYHALVIGTSNKTERLLGYGTIHGDMACAINPIGNLYKTQLQALAKYIGVPDFILTKPPSADLWHNQTDEGEIGYLYKDIDELLFFMVDRKQGSKELLKKGFSREFISDIRARIKNNSFKQSLPLVAGL